MKMTDLFQSVRTALLKRPLCYACGLFLTLLFGVLYAEWQYALIAGLVCLVLAIACLALFFLRAQRRSVLLALTAGALIASSAALLTAHISLEYDYHRKTDRVIGLSGQAVVVVTAPEDATAYSTACQGELVTLDGEEIGLEGIFYFPYEASLEIGDRLMADISLTPIREETADLSDCYSLSQGLYYNAEVIGTHLNIGETLRFPQTTISSLTDALSAILMRYLPADACGLANALLLGDKSELSDELSGQFRNLGISHTLAVSGLHLGILLGSLSWLMKKLHIPRRAHLWILLPLTLLYMLIVGSRSVMRAGGMLLLMLISHSFGRRRDSLTSLFASVTLICLISPFSVLDIGLLLSFFSTFGILLVGLPLTKRCRALPAPLRWLTDSLILTASALTFTMPFSIWYFGDISLITPLANLFFVPLITLWLYLIPLLLLLSPFPLLAAAPAYALGLLAKLTFSAAQLIGARDTFMLSLELPLIRIIGLIGLILCIGLLCFRKTRPTVLACTALFLTFSSIYFYIHTLGIGESHSVYAYNDGENDALLLRDGTRVILCDASDGSYAFLTQAIECAEQDPAVRVDSLLLTHYHFRALATLTRLLGDSHIEHLILPLPDSDHTDLALTIEARAKRVGCKVYYYSTEENLVGYHGYSLLIDSDASGSHPLNALTVSYNGEKIVSYAAEVEGSAGFPPLRANHHAEIPPDSALWNRCYD